MRPQNASTASLRLLEGISMKFTILGALPDLNEYVNACRTKAYAGHRMSEAAKSLVGWQLPKPTDIRHPVDIHLSWYEQNNRKDPDNVAFAVKFILDAMVTAGLLFGDSRRYINSISHTFHTDKERPRIEVLVESTREAA